MSELTMDDFYGYTYAMEVVNGEIISMSGNFQHKVRTALKKKLHVSDKTLQAFLSAMSAGEECEDPRFEPVADLEYDVLAAALGFDGDDFTDEGIGFLECRYGWEVNDLLESLGFKLSEKINYGPHGHGTFGVKYYGRTARS